MKNSSFFLNKNTKTAAYISCLNKPVLFQVSKKKHNHSLYIRIKMLAPSREKRNMMIRKTKKDFSRNRKSSIDSSLNDD